METSSRNTRSKKSLEEEKKTLLRNQESELQMRAKLEVDTLRSRFKIMQSSGALDRSPSTSESELPIEVRFKGLRRLRVNVEEQTLHFYLSFFLLIFSGTRSNSHFAPFFAA